VEENRKKKTQGEMEKNPTAGERKSVRGHYRSGSVHQGRIQKPEVLSS